MADNEKKCRACKRVIIGKSRFGLCPDCLNKYGSPVIAAGAVGLAVGGRFLIKNGGKVIGVLGKGIKMIKP